MYGFHGLHAEEAKVGTYFFIRIQARLHANYESEQPSLRNTINYEDLYNVLEGAFSKREELIEQVAVNIYNTVKSEFRQADKWFVSIEKQNPIGIEGFNPVFEISDFG